MTRRRQQSVLDDIFDLLKVTPIWIGPVLAVVWFVVFRFVIPASLPDEQGSIDGGALLQPLLSMLAWTFAGAIVVAWVVAEIWKLMNRRLLDSQSGLESIRDISWRELERLARLDYGPSDLVEPTRRLGYVHLF